MDKLLVQDPYSRVSCKVTCTENQMHLFGESTSNPAGMPQASSGLL